MIDPALFTVERLLAEETIPSAWLLDPPIIYETSIDIDRARERALDHLNALHGRADGVPVDETPAPAHVEATRTMTRGKIVRFEVYAITPEGRLLTRLPPEDR